MPDPMTAVLLALVALIVAGLVFGLAAGAGWCIVADAYRATRRKISARRRQLRSAMSTATDEYLVIPGYPPSAPPRLVPLPTRPRVDRRYGHVYYSSSELSGWPQ